MVVTRSTVRFLIHWDFYWNWIRTAASSHILLPFCLKWPAQWFKFFFLILGFFQLFLQSLTLHGQTDNLYTINFYANVEEAYLEVGGVLLMKLIKIAVEDCVMHKDWSWWQRRQPQTSRRDLSSLQGVTSNKISAASRSNPWGLGLY